VLDDNAVIAQNAFTKQGLAGLSEIFSTDMFYGFSQSDVAKELVTGGRYRPLSQALFAVIYQFFDDKPFAYHLVAVLLFALTCAVLYRASLSLFGKNEFGLLLAWMTALLFVVHPVHAEVVNNMKSCDETLALLFSLLSLRFALRALQEQSFKWALWAGFTFLLACFSKENAIAFTALIPLALWMKMKEEPQLPENAAQRIARICLPLWAAFLIFFLVRGIVLNWTFGAAQLNVINNPFVKYDDGRWVFFSLEEKFATIAYTLGKYVQLLLFPHPLTTDYYPRHIGIKTIADSSVWLSVAVNLLPLGYAVWSLVRHTQPKTDNESGGFESSDKAADDGSDGFEPSHKAAGDGSDDFESSDQAAVRSDDSKSSDRYETGAQNPTTGKIGPVVFGILFYFSTVFIVSNILFPTGVNMAERFVFIPSVGFCLAVAGGIVHVLTFRKLVPSTRDGKFGLAVLAAFCAVCLAFAVRTFVRNFDFSDSKTLLFKDIQVSPNSAKGQSSVGGILLQEGIEEKDSLKMRDLVSRAIAHFDSALQIHPTYAEAFFARGTAHYFLKNYPAAIKDLNECVKINPGRKEVKSNLAAALFEAGKEVVEKNGDPNQALQYLLASNQLMPNIPETAYYLGVSFSRAGNQQRAINILTQLVNFQPGNTAALSALSNAYRLAGDEAKADEINELIRNAGPTRR
jgi:Flp pilus assembly protein TadD